MLFLSLSLTTLFLLEKAFKLSCTFITAAYIIYHKNYLSSYEVVVSLRLNHKNRVPSWKLSIASNTNLVNIVNGASRVSQVAVVLLEGEVHSPLNPIYVIHQAPGSTLSLYMHGLVWQQPPDNVTEARVHANR